MSEPLEPEFVEDPEKEHGIPTDAAITHGWFEGILQGHVGQDPEALRAAVRRLSRAGLAEADLRIEGGRFSILMNESTITGDRFTEARAQAFRDALEDLVEVLPRGQSLESTLRCTMVSAGEATETLFGVVSGHVRPVSRKRPLRPSDEARSPTHGQIPQLQHLGYRKLVVVLALLLVAFGAIAWQSGYIDQVFSPAAQRLEVDTGDFRELLEISVDSSWGVYRLELRRGPRFPDQASDVEALLTARQSTREQAAVRVVADGDVIWAQLRDAEGGWLGASAAPLRPLLEDPAAVVRLELRGRIGSRRIQLALSSGQKNGRR